MNFLLSPSLMKLALASAVVYVGIVLLLQIALLLVVRFTGAIVGIQHSRLGIALLLGITWFISFSLAWRLLRLR